MTLCITEVRKCQIRGEKAFAKETAENGPCGFAMILSDENLNTGHWTAGMKLLCRLAGELVGYTRDCFWYTKCCTYTQDTFGTYWKKSACAILERLWD